MREDCKDGKISMVLSPLVESLIGLPGFRYVENVYIFGSWTREREEHEAVGTCSRELGSEAAAST